MIAQLALLILFAETPPATMQQTPTPAPALAPLRLKTNDDWGEASSVDENDAARFAPARPAAVSSCKSENGTVICGGDAKTQEAAKAALKDLTKPD